MQRISQWVLSGLVTMVLWAPMAGAQEGNRAWNTMRQDRPRGTLGQGREPQSLPGLGQNRRPDPAQMAPIGRGAPHYGWQDHHAPQRERRDAWRAIQPDRHQLWQDRRDNNHGALGNDRARLRQDWHSRHQNRHELRYDRWWPPQHHHHHHRW